MLKNINKDDVISFNYTNWQGKKSRRTAIYIGVAYGTNEYHKREKLIIRGFDLDKMAERTYTAKDVTDMTVIPKEFR